MLAYMVSFVPLVRPTITCMALQAQSAREQGVPVMARRKEVMGYVAPADTQPLLNLLGGSKQLLKKFQGLLELQLAGPSASCQTPLGKLPKTRGGTGILQSFLACRLDHWCSLHTRCTMAVLNRQDPRTTATARAGHQEWRIFDPLLSFAVVGAAISTTAQTLLHRQS